MMLHKNQRVLLCLLLLGALISARGELVLANFSTANPIKIMAVGDSITDDCVFNGAWRQYLQPLLDTNGYPFTFVGRVQSSVSGSFTKTHHEGYCGAVIAPPGVMTTPVNGYAGADVYLQTIVADAFTNGTTPDLVLLLIGVNDIGRGRNPYFVATNDMPNLLDIIFSHAPNANVILTKVTSLYNANLTGLNYAAYAANIPIYNAALQAMVNHRRALGQNVFLADIFSVVDIGTMYNGDHVHPNATGLQAVAQEWFTRIQSIIITTNQVTSTLIHGGDVWKYSDTGQDLGTSWSQTNFNDSGWSSGPARLGFGDPTVFTTVSSNRQITTYFRDSFVVPGNVTFTNLNLRLTRVDGAVVWLNGQEAFRTNLPAGPITYTSGGLTFHFLPDKHHGVEFARGNEPGRGGSSFVRNRQKCHWHGHGNDRHGFLFALALHRVCGQQPCSHLAGCQRNRLYALYLNQLGHVWGLDKCRGYGTDQQRAICCDLVARYGHKIFSSPESLAPCPPRKIRKL